MKLIKIRPNGQRCHNVHWRVGLLSLFLLTRVALPMTLAADDQSNGQESADRKATPEKKSDTASGYEPSQQVKDVLTPLFSQINQADVSRCKVELSAETVMNGRIVLTEKSTYQIASKYPDQYTIYHKGEDERKRVYASKQGSVVAMAPDAYFELPEVIGSQALVNSSPINLGPYPEPLLALTLAGVDPSLTFLGGMKSVDVVGREKFRGITEALRLRGQQTDGVVWDFWITDEENPRPLRLLVNLTPMLIAADEVRVPRGYEYSLRYDFQSWRITGEVDDNLFVYVPPKDSTKYESLEDYRQRSSEKLAEHPLLGKQSPPYTLTLLDGTKVKSREHRGKVVVLDFWATWCTPCLRAMPVIIDSVSQYQDKDVVFYAVAVGENPDLVRGYLSEQDWEADFIIDPDGKLMNDFHAGSIPLTLIIAPSGIVEVAHVGFPGAEALAAQFKDELDVLVKGGRIASSKVPNDQDSGNQENPPEQKE